MTEHMTPKSVWKLDQLRHTSPKIARRMTRGGNGSRTKQYAALTAMEGNPMAQVVIDANQGQSTRRATTTAGFVQLTAEAPPETKRRYDQYKAVARKRMSVPAFFTALLDAYEERQNRSPNVAGITSEAANVLASFQSKHNLPSQLETVKRLVDSHATAANRGLKITEQDKTITEMRATILRVERERNTLQEEVRQLREMRHIKTAPVTAIRGAAPHTEVEGCLLDFADAFAGATMTADPSGDVIVALAPTQLAKMFPLWQRTVKVLGISKREAA